jgi:methylmalonyl-CoA/ethylmalonyl-CoA epimerase
MLSKLHHIGIACKDINEEIEQIRKIHTVVDVSPIVSDANQRAELCIVKTAEGISIELIAGEQVQNIVKKRMTYYHLCFETENIEGEIQRLQELGGFVVSEPKPAILFNNKKVAFVQVSYGLIELVETII